MLTIPSRPLLPGPSHAHSSQPHAILTVIPVVLQTSIRVLRSTFLVHEQGRIARPGTTSRRTATPPRSSRRSAPRSERLQRQVAASAWTGSAWQAVMRVIFTPTVTAARARLKHHEAGQYHVPRQDCPEGDAGHDHYQAQAVGGRPAACCAWSRLVDDMARGHAERRCSGPCPQQTRPPRPSPSRGSVHSWCPGPGSGKRRAGQLRRSTRLGGRLPWPRTGHSPVLGRQEGRDLELLLLGALLVVAALADLGPSASAVDAVACWLPTLGGCVAWPR